MIEKLEYINKVIPTIIGAMIELSITSIKAPEGETNYYLSSEKKYIQFSKNSYDDNAYSENVGMSYFNSNIEKLDMIYNDTKELQKRINSLLNNKIQKLQKFIIN